MPSKLNSDHKNIPKKPYNPTTAFTLIMFSMISMALIYLNSWIRGMGNIDSIKKDVSQVFNEQPQAQIVEQSQQEPAFDLKEHILSSGSDTIMQIPSYKKFFYLKESNLYFIDLSSQNPQSLLILDMEEEILTFAISHDGEKIAYTLEASTEDDNPDDQYIFKAGDTIRIFDMQTTEDRVIYKKSNEELDLRDLIFTIDNQNLIFTNNTVTVINLNNLQRRELAKEDPQAFCSLFFLGGSQSATHFPKQEPDVINESKLIVRNACYEGSYQRVLDLKTGQSLADFNNGYTEILNFIDFLFGNNYLGYSNTGEGPLERRIFNNKAEVEKDLIYENSNDSAYIPLGKDSPEGKFITGIKIGSTEYSDNTRMEFFELNEEDASLTPLVEQKDLIVYIEKENSTELWLTDTNFSKQIQIDQVNDYESYTGIKF